MITLLQIGITTFLIVTAACVVIWFVRSQKPTSSPNDELADSHRQFMASLDRLADAVVTIDLATLDTVVKQLTASNRERSESGVAGRPAVPVPAGLGLQTSPGSNARIVYLSAFTDALPLYCLYHTSVYGGVRDLVLRAWETVHNEGHARPINIKAASDVVYHFYDMFSFDAAGEYDSVPEAEDDEPLVYYLDPDRYYEMPTEWRASGRDIPHNAIVVPNARLRV